MAFDSLAHNQEQLERQQQAAFEWYSLGQQAAAEGDRPEYANPDFLRGYCATVQSLPRDGEGRVIYPSPRRGFALGYVDTAEQFSEF